MDGLTVAAVAHRLGVAPSTLRTWDRRYGLGPTHHASGSHRRYGEGDLARLEAMRRLVVQGVAPAEAARQALADAPGPPDHELLPGAPPDAQVVRGLNRAALALDADAVSAVVSEQLRERGVVRTWEEVLVPVLVAAGVRWETTGEGVDVEHLLCGAIARALHQHVPVRPPSGRTVLLACAPGDHHDLPLQALAAALGEQGRSCRSLGAAVPLDALRAAVRRTSPAVLLVWSQRPETADLALLEVPATRPATAVVVGGPGWPGTLPPGVSRVAGLGAATALVARVLRGLPVPSTG